ncbi:MAG TPA: HD domain-containing phosphohydrolase, partial [Spirochaetota bacterium]|nr:HD domain-containing phosphohydrolase [Spirochaetota bacterium]
VDYFSPIIPMIRHHHEWYHGGGYPDRLSGEAIPLEARIMAVADTYDAMTSDRPYRKAMSRDRALEIIREVAGVQLDPEVVRVFINEKIYTIHHSSSEKLMLNFNA